MELWRKVWREGLIPQMTQPGLEALRQGLLRDDPRLVQGVTLSPPAVDVFADAEIEAACALGYCAWKGEDRSTVSDLSDFFEKLCVEADERLGEPGLCRFFLNWFDETPRHEMRRLLLAEVNRGLNHAAATAA